jgi:hypothetical protein
MTLANWGRDPYTGFVKVQMHERCSSNRQHARQRRDVASDASGRLVNMIGNNSIR